MERIWESDKTMSERRKYTGKGVEVNDRPQDESFTYLWGRIKGCGVEGRGGVTLTTRGVTERGGGPT